LRQVDGREPKVGGEDLQHGFLRSDVYVLSLFRLRVTHGDNKCFARLRSTRV
jgi:hypothetical protein